MSYQVLARKYRPQRFEDIVGQTHVATTLTNALRHQKVAHAYLFSGPRGVGKTTMARLLAKALNCVKGPTPSPCNACDPCLRIAQGQEMVDVLEIDAASNRGIEEIRELRENVRYAPARSRYKVYIVDEAHQITHDAFNAFLKTLEEPPEHAVFVLATTEHQKIPATILSRCQQFRFKRVSAADITGRIEKILAEENVRVEPAAVARLARAAGGSVRDALSLLDQALSYTEGTLTSLQVEMLLGFLPEEFLIGFASALLERKPAGVLEWIRQLVEEGWDLPQFVRDFREFLRQTIVEQLQSRAPGEKTPPAPESPGTGMLQLAGRPVSLAELLQIIKILGHALDEMRWNDNPRLVLELHALRLTLPFVDAGALLQRLEDLERAAGNAATLPRDEATAPPPAPASPAPRAPLAPSAGPVRPAAARDSAPASGTVPPDPDALPDAAAVWKKCLTDMWKKPTIASHLERARVKSAGTKEWVFAFSDRFALDAVQRGLSFVEETLAAAMGRAVSVRLVQDASDRREGENATVVIAPAAPAPSGPPVPAGLDSFGDTSAVKDPRVQKVLDIFQGRVRLPEQE